MALYRCKLSIRDPLLIVLEAVDKTQPINSLLAAQRKDPDGKITVVGLEENEEIYLVNAEFLPIEYNFTDLIGLELRKVQAAFFSREHEPAVELLVGKRKLIFFEQDLEEIRND